MISILAIRKQQVKHLCILLLVLPGIWPLTGYTKPDEHKISKLEKQQNPEEEYWVKTKNTHTEDAYRKYILLSNQGKFSGKYSDDASKAIQDIWDDKAWERVEKLKTVSAYREYVEGNTHGKHRKEALRYLATVEGTRSAASTPSPKPGRKFEATPPPDKASRPPARNVNIDVSKIPMMYEDSVWSSSIEWNSELAYMNYVDQFPNGRFLDEALQKVPIKVSIVRNNEANSRSSFNLSYAKNPVVISRIDIEKADKTSRLRAIDLLSSFNRSVNMQGDSVYTYSVRDEGLVARIDMSQPVASKVAIQTNNSSAFKIQFRDALGRTAEISLEAVAEEFNITYISGYSEDQDTLFFKVKGGKPPFSAQFFELDRYIVRHEAELQKDHQRGDPNLWFLDKNKIKSEADLAGEYYLSLWDQSKQKSIEHNRMIQFEEGFLSNSEDIILFLIIAMFLILPVSWLYMKHKNSKQPKFEPIR